MQIYRRISNPFMPNATPNLTNSPSPFYAPGEIGCTFSDQNTGGEYLRVALDSGATATAASGVVQAGMLAFWKDKNNGIVTNDKNQCDAGPVGAINRVAGIFQTAVTAAPGVNGTDGNPVQYMCDLVIRKNSFPVKATGTIVPGAQMIADSTASVARGISAATVTTAPVSQTLGVCLTSVIAADGTTPVDVSIAFSE